MLLRQKPYKIQSYGFDQMKLNIPQNSGLKGGEMVYLNKKTNGIIEIIPESLYLEKNNIQKE